MCWQCLPSRVQVCLEGPDPLHLCPRRPAMLDVAVKDVSAPPAEGAGDRALAPALFSPPLSVQRHEAVAALLAEIGARTVLDAGMSIAISSCCALGWQVQEDVVQ